MEAPRRFYGGAKEVLWGCQGGFMGAPRRFYGGAKEVLWGHQGGSMGAPRRFYGGALPYSNIRNIWQDLTPESSAKNTVKYVVSWIRIDISIY